MNRVLKKGLILGGVKLGLIILYYHHWIICGIV